jgi:hypothetical protein
MCTIQPSAQKVNSETFGFIVFSAPLCQAALRDGACKFATRLL